MNFKKIIAASAAAAIAVTALSVNAFAADFAYAGSDDAPSESFTGYTGAITVPVEGDSNWVNFVRITRDAVKEAWLADETMTVVMTVDDADNAYFKLAGNDEQGNWSSTAFEGNVSTFWKDAYNADKNELTITADQYGAFADIFIQGGKGITVYGIALTSDTATIDAAKALISSGEEVITQPSTDKANSDTGVEGVAVIAGIAIIATGAVLVSKKRK